MENAGIPIIRHLSKRCPYIISWVCDIGMEDDMAAPACDSLHKAAGRIPEACRLQPPLPSLHRRHVLWHVVHREINMTLPPLLTPLKLNY